VYIYDKRLRHALHQLTLKVYHLDLYNDADKRKIQKKMFKLAKRIWDWWQRQKMTGDGRVGEALGASGPLEQRGLELFEPRVAGALRKQGRTGKEPAPSKAPNTRPTDDLHNHVLTHPLFPSHTYQFTRL
jgi:hypothetical protein